MTDSREQLEKRLRELKAQRDEATVSGLAVPGVAGGIFNDRVHDLNAQIELVEREIEQSAGH